jgi:hypothetical protein
MATEIRSIGPPQRYSNLHQRFLAAIDGIKDVIDDKSSGFPDRAVHLFEQSQILKNVRAELGEDSQEDYTQMVVKVLDRYRLDVIGSIEKSQDSLRRPLLNAKKLRPPKGWLARHETYLQVLTEYASAINSYYAAIWGDSVEAVRKAAMMVSVARSALEVQNREYAVELWLWWENPWAIRQANRPEHG